MIQKLDSCDGIDKESGCPSTEQINVFVAWPPIELKPLRKSRKPSLEESSDICIDDSMFNHVENKDLRQRPQEFEAEP